MRALETYESGEQVPDGETNPVEPLILPPFDMAPGCHPYWVRVVQTDGAKAWASPIYVTIE